MEKVVFLSIHRFQRTSYVNIVGMRESGYKRMHPIEEIFNTSSQNPLQPPLTPGSGGNLRKAAVGLDL